MEEVVSDDAPVDFSLELEPKVGAFVVEHDELTSKIGGPLVEASSRVEVELGSLEASSRMSS